jgi:hypothetical protein
VRQKRTSGKIISTRNEYPPAAILGRCLLWYLGNISFAQSEKMTTINFYEQQQFRQKWTYLIYVLLIALLGLFVYADMEQIILGKSFGDKPASNFVLILLPLLMLVTLLLFYLTKLETRVDEEGIFYKWTPFNKKYKKISWSDINKIEIIKYSFVGYGWRLTQYGTVFNVKRQNGAADNFKNR